MENKKIIYLIKIVDTHLYKLTNSNDWENEELPVNYSKILKIEETQPIKLVQSYHTNNSSKDLEALNEIYSSRNKEEGWLAFYSESDETVKKLINYYFSIKTTLKNIDSIFNNNGKLKDIGNIRISKFQQQNILNPVEVTISDYDKILDEINALNSFHYFKGKSKFISLKNGKAIIEAIIEFDSKAIMKMASKSFIKGDLEEAFLKFYGKKIIIDFVHKQPF